MESIQYFTKGRVAEFGSYDELKTKKTDFATLLTSKENKSLGSSNRVPCAQTGFSVLTAKGTVSINLLHTWNEVFIDCIGGPEILVTASGFKGASTIQALSYKTDDLKVFMFMIRMKT